MQTLLGRELRERSDLVGKRHEKDLVFGIVVTKERREKNPRSLEFAAKIHTSP
jgi:hypothetical protein